MGNPEATLPVPLGSRDIEREFVEVVEEIHVFDKNLVRNVDAGARKVEDAAHARVKQVIGGALRSFRRRGDDPDFNIEIAQDRKSVV